MIPRLNDLIKIAEHLSLLEDDNCLSDAEITFKVPQDILQKLNEDFYYRNNDTGTPEENPEEINLMINGYHFKYITE